VGAKSFCREAGNLERPAAMNAALHMECAMTADDQDIHRHIDGAIDFDYYRRLAALLRREAFRQMVFRIRAFAKWVAGQALHF
jgi:hypothetical protein